MHSGATPLLRGFSRKNIFCQKIFDNFFSFQATEMVLTSKWGRIQPEIQIWPDQVVAASWTLVGSPKHAEKMLIQLISATAPSWPTVHSGFCSPGNWVQWNFTEEVSHIINHPSKLPNIFRLSSKDAETEMVSASIWAKRFELEENKTVRIDHQKII